jgi:hypothetical protein
VTDKASDMDTAPRPTIEEGPTADEPPVVCRKLRTKLGFGALQGVRDWRHGDSSTAAYWCLSTMESAGPDNGFAHPHGCRAGRACYIAPPGEEDAGLVAMSEPRGPRDRG